MDLPRKLKDNTAQFIGMYIIPHDDDTEVGRRKRSSPSINNKMDAPFMILRSMSDRTLHLYVICANLGEKTLDDMRALLAVAAKHGQ